MGTKGGLPRPLNQKTARQLLEQDGWTKKVGGKHQVKMTKPGERPIPLPHYKGKDYPVGLAQAILKQAGLWREED